MNGHHPAWRTGTAALIAASAAIRLLAQVPTTSFAVTGYIQRLELCQPADPGCSSGDPLSMARMTVNDIQIVLPKNLILTMPGTYMTAHDLFRGPNGTPTSPLQARSGLAITDPLPAGMSPHVAEVVGNIVDGTYIAGLVRISHEPLQLSAGYVVGIDSARGEIQVGPKGTTAGARVRLNDPTGRFGKAQSPDVRFTMDIENPTVHASTGYPVCIPRAAPDVLCPAINRPTVADLPAAERPLASETSGTVRRFTIGTTRATPDAPACPTCDPTRMAPLALGDYVTYAGIPASDGGAPYTSAYMLEAELGIYTSPGSDPVYVSQEETLIGTGGIPFPGLDQETGPGKVVPGQSSVTRFRIVGFTTDPSRNVDVFAIDLDRTTGDEHPRLIASVRPEPIAPIGRFRVTVDQSVFLPPTMEVRARVQGISGTAQSQNGLVWGTYTAPIGEYIFPEGRLFGRGVIPANFENFCFLLTGSGPLKTMGRTGVQPVVGTLSPWPSSGHSQPEVSCAF